MLVMRFPGINFSSQRVAVFVDVGNMYHSAKHLYNARVNFKEVLKAAEDSRQLIRAIAYVIRSKTLEEEKFFEALASQGFEVKIKDLQVFAGGIKKGDWDVGMTVDAIQISTKSDVSVLVTGDGDFVPLVKHLQFLGQRVEIIAFGPSASNKLIEEADSFLDLASEEKRFLLPIKKQ